MNFNILFRIPLYAWLTVSAVFFACGELLSKKFALHPSVSYVILILVVYSISVLAWLPAIIEKNQLSIVGSIWSVLSLLLTVLIGVIIFREQLTMTGIIGIVFAIIAIALLSFA